MALPVIAFPVFFLELSSILLFLWKNQKQMVLLQYIVSKTSNEHLSSDSMLNVLILRRNLFRCPSQNKRTFTSNDWLITST